MPRRIFRQFLFHFLVILIFLPVLAACRAPAPVRVTEIVRVRITATPPPPTSKPLPSATPTTVPTPTPTALPVVIRGDPYLEAFATPNPEPGAYCGYVDTFDFPLNPPDADGIRGGQDFGVYRSRYGKYHAGEDWGFRGGGSFGEPVYAIGHGTVTYADGLGWGPDQGVVIIRHYFPDGSTVLSFYGHLDPPSVTLIPGACITRGTQVGQIGRPRTSPHLHFEIRTTMPFVPGPGYWEADPAEAGWLPPSAYIAEFRMRQIPGTRWVRTGFPAEEILGMFGEETYVLRENRLLYGLYAPAGGVRWVHELEARPLASVVSGERLFVLSAGGRLDVLRYPSSVEDLPEGTALVLDWQAVVPDAQGVLLAAAPWGGVVLASADEITAYTPDGSVRWRQPVPGPVSGLAAESGLVVAMTVGEGQSAWVFDAAGTVSQLPVEAGISAIAADGLYFMGRGALYYSVGVETIPEEVIALPAAILESGMVSVPGGGVVLRYTDREDDRLMYLRDGELVWERSLRGMVPVGSRPVSDGRSIYLLASENDGGSETVSLFRIAIEVGRLELVFSGGTRFPATGRLNGASPETGVLMLRFGEDSVVVFERVGP